MQSVSYDAAEAGEIVEHVSEIRGGRAGQTGTAACPGQGRSAYTSARPSPRRRRACIRRSGGPTARDQLASAGPPIRPSKAASSV